MKRSSQRIVLAFSIGTILAMAFQNCSEMAPVTGTYQSVFASGAIAPSLKFIETPKTFDGSSNSRFVFELLGETTAAVATIGCKVDDRPFVDCSTGRFNADGLSDGRHGLVIEVSTAGGDRAEYEAFSWTVDTQLPAQTIAEGPKTFDPMNSATISFSSSDIGSGLAAVECRFDEGEFSVCESPLILSDLSDGDHRFTLRSTDVAGNSANLDVNWKVDTVLPNVIVNSAPMALTSIRSSTITFTGVDAGSGVSKFECSIEGGATSLCQSPISLSNLVDGPHSVKIWAKDRAGNSSALREVTWVVDATAPEITLASNVGAFSNSSTATFTFSGTDNGAPITRFNCSLDGQPLGACTSPLTVTDLTDGTHVFSVTGLDEVRNESAPMAVSFYVDLQAPRLMLTPDTNATSARSVTLPFSVDDFESGIEAVRCTLNAGSPSDCTSPVTYSNLSLGLATISVTVTDRAGNAVTKTASYEIVPSLTKASGLALQSTLQMARSGTTLYTGTQAIDVTIRGNPTLRSYSNSINPHAVAFSGSNLLQLSGPYLDYYDVSSPLAPSLTKFTLSGFPSGTSPQFTRSVDASGVYGYGCWGDYDTQIDKARLGIFKVTATVLVASEVFASSGPPSQGNPFPDGIQNCTAEQTAIYVSRARSTVVYPIENQIAFGSPRVYEKGGSIYGHLASGNVFVGTEYGAAFRINVFDTSVAGTEPVGAIEIPSSATTAYLKNGYLFVTMTADGNNYETRLYDLRNPASPQLKAIGKSSTPLYATEIDYPYVFSKSNTELYTFVVQ